MENVNCSLCHSKEYSVQLATSDYITDEVQTLVRCTYCGFVYVNPQPTTDEFSKYYPKNYYGDDPFFYEKVDNFLRFKKIRKIFPKKTGNILDIGCGKGLLLKSLEEIGWTVHGIELSDTSASYAKKKLGIKIQTQLIDSCNFQDEKFDLITMFHSLEHMKDPKKVLKDIHAIIAEDGILIIEVPKFDSFFSKLFKDKWFHLDLPRHLYHFENHTMNAILKDTGFRIVYHRNFSFFYDIFGNTQSFFNCFCSKFNLINDFNTKRLTLKSIKASDQRVRVFSELLFCNITFPISFLIMLLISIVFSFFGQGGTLIIHAQKANIQKTL